MAARLAADMFPLAAQVRFAAYQAHEAVFRLRGERVPKWLDAIAAEGRNVGDAPGTTMTGPYRGVEMSEKGRGRR